MDCKSNCFTIFNDFIERFPTHSRWHLAFSGGLDSCVLLSLLANWRLTYPHIELNCIHVHHGLSESADKWSEFCDQVCRELNIPFFMEKVQVPLSGNIEANARSARYNALKKYFLSPKDVLFTAHHQDDQAETFLLQLLRGAGLKGLSAMPLVSDFAEGFHFRPLLSLTRDELLQYAQQNQLQWVNDESNENPHFDRNYLRQNIIPLLKKRWPALTRTIARASTHLADTQQFVDKSIHPHFLNVQTDEPNRILLEPLKQFSSFEQQSVLRFWFEKMEVAMPNQAVTTQLLKSVINAKTDAVPVVSWGGFEVRRYQNQLYVMPKTLNLPHSIITWDFPNPVQVEGLGILVAELSAEGGLKPPPANTQVTIRFRGNGEKIAIHKRRGHHKLKKLFQEWQIPPWERDRIPLIYYGDELVCVAGYAIAEGWFGEERVLKLRYKFPL